MGGQRNKVEDQKIEVQFFRGRRQGRQPLISLYIRQETLQEISGQNLSNDLNNLHSSFSHASLALCGQNVMSHGRRGNHGARFFPAMAVAARCVAKAETGKSAPST